MVNVGKYTSPMDPMGIYIYICHPSLEVKEPPSKQIQVTNQQNVIASMPRKALMFRDWGRIGNNSEDWTYTTDLFSRWNLT